MKAEEVYAKLKKGIGKKTEIDDANVSNKTTYSSEKIVNKIKETDNKVDELKKDIGNIKEQYGRNLFYFNEYKKGDVITKNGLTIEFLTNSKIKIDGTSNSLIWIGLREFTPGQYTFNRYCETLVTGEEANRIPIIKVDTKDWHNNTTINLTDTTWINFVILKGWTYNNDIYNFSIVTGEGEDYTEGGIYSAIDIVARKNIDEIAQTIIINEYTNPVCLESSADPCLIQDGNLYYMFVTGNTIQGFRSCNLFEWEHVETFDTSVYTEIEKDISFNIRHMWAPHVIEYNNLYHMFAVVVGTNTYTQNAIIRFTSNTLEGNWRYSNVVTSYDLVKIKDSIDPCVVIDNDGTLKMFFGSSHGIYCGVLDDSYSLMNNTLKVIHEKNGEDDGGARIEGVSIFYRNGYYYMLASEGSTAFKGNYKIVVARSKTIDGEYFNKDGQSIKSKDVHGSIILVGDNQFSSTGHNSDVIIDKNGDYWVIYHAWNGDDNTSRHAMLGKIDFDNEGFPYFKNGVVHKAIAPKL